jgi:hypothetical protein
MVVKTNSAGLVTPSQQKAALDAAKKPTTVVGTPSVIAAPKTATPAFNQTLNLYGAPTAPKQTSGSQSSGAKGSDSKAAIDARIAAANAKTTEALKPIQEKIESWGYKIDPNTGLYDLNSANTTPSGNTNTGGGDTGGGQQPPAGGGSTVIPNVAYDTIAKILESYNITGLASVLESIRKEYPEADSNDLITLLQFDSRYNTKFNERFSANATRQKAGMKVLSPAEYLAMEQGYKKTLDAYGLTTFKTQAYYDKFIANDLAVTEVTDRISLAYDRVLNDTSINKAFRDFYPSLTTTDIITGMLDPVNQFPALERKVKAAEIGGAALRQGLTASELATTAETSKAYSNVTSATLGADVLAQQGVTKTGAETGYQNIAMELPTAEKLSSIYGTQTDQYGRLQAEQAQFQGLASAKRAKQRLIDLEVGSFSGTSGRYQGRTTASQQI